MTSNGKPTNGTPLSVPSGRPLTPPPDAVHDLADACVKFVAKALGITLDYTLETLPILDHYLRDARRTAPLTANAPSPVTALVAHAAGAYLGEVVRRRHASWWRLGGTDPSGWRLELEAVYLSFSPVQMVADALYARPASPASASRGPGEELADATSRESPPTEDEGADPAAERLELEEDDRAAVAERLAQLPEVPEDEFYAPSTRVEVIDIAVEAIRARRLSDGEADGHLTPEDYED